ncbi:HAD family hydrolase [Pseudomonas sp. NPDC089534]|uniref:HAD family hydrolase n=1 Tax=Pseudomonas sp. NPDC089534 TaxID=3364468 RepID=UPI0037FDB9CA
MQLQTGSLISTQALLFDMDGTLVDSTAVVERTWGRFAQRHGLDLAQVLHAAHGRRTAETVAMFAPPGVDTDAETARIVAEEVADTDGIVEVPGARRFLQRLPANRWAVVTSASRELAIRRMQAAGVPIPPILITAEDVASGKPAPEGYLAAARALGVDPAHCLSFEDAPAGLQSAHAAGTRVIALATTLKAEDLRGEDWIADFHALQALDPADDQRQVLHFSVQVDTRQAPRTTPA